MAPQLFWFLWRLMSSRKSVDGGESTHEEERWSGFWSCPNEQTGSDRTCLVCQQTVHVRTETQVTANLVTGAKGCPVVLPGRYVTAVR
jgi:hypothetical protein